MKKIIASLMVLVVLGATGLWAQGAVEPAKAEASTQLPAGFPAKNFELIVPAGPGSAADVPARILVDLLDLGKPIAVVNIAGASQTIGSAEAATRTADGYHLLWGGPGAFQIQHWLLDLSYTMDDFRHISLTAPAEPLVIVVTPTSPIKTINDLLAKLKDGAALTYSAANPGSVGHIAMVALLQQLGAKNARFVAYNGSAEGTAAVLGGHLDFFVADLTEVIPRARSNQYVPLAVFASSRIETFPEVPTLNELGYKDMAYEAIKWICVLKDTPEPIVQFLKAKIDAAVMTEEYQAFHKKNAGMTFKPVSEAELTQMIRDYREKFGNILKALGMSNKK
jgi:tripartite-type tricarboxylate transporter receptor subunit TctC